MTDKPIGRGTVLAGRFRLEDLVQDTDGARFWRAVDQTLARSVAVNVIPTSDARSEALLVAARTSATITEGHFLRVLDAAREDGVVYVVHEWGNGMSLDKLLAEGPLPPRRAAWLVKEVADAISFAHSHGIAHGRLVPENVMVTEAGSVKLIGFVVDAVLHGRRQPVTADGRVISDHESDVYNLAGLLYATLVGRWPCSQECSLPPAPRDHDRTLRPRQVRAGVPRALDAVCDQVLNPAHSQGSLETAQEISAALSDFIGEAAGAPVGPEPTVLIERDEHARFRPVHRAEPATGTSTRAPDPEDTQAAPAPSRHADPEATQAAGPLFHDEAPRRRTPPPEPVEQPAEHSARPLFAPGPPRAPHAVAGADPALRHTGSSAQGTGRDAGPATGSGTGHGTGSLPPVWGPDHHATDDEQPGWGRADTSRDWLKLAAAVAVIVVLVVAIVFAYNMGRGANQAPSAQPTRSASPSPTPVRPLPVASVTDLDPPPAGNGEENPDLVDLAVDGDPSTAWQTMEYYRSPRFGNLKPGAGLVVDLGSAEEVRSVEVTVQGEPTSFEVLAASDGSSSPTDVGSLRRVAAADAVGGRTRLMLEEPVTTQYLVVWLTSLPPVDGAFRGRIAEIVVKG